MELNASWTLAGHATATVYTGGNKYANKLNEPQEMEIFKA